MTDNVTGEEQSGHSGGRSILPCRLAGGRLWAFADTLGYPFEPLWACLGQRSPSSASGPHRGVSPLCPVQSAWGRMKFSNQVKIGCLMIELSTFCLPGLVSSSLFFCAKWLLSLFHHIRNT